MAFQKSGQESLRKITKVGKRSFSITLPIDLIRKLGWREKQKVKVRQKGKSLKISDWKK